MEAHWTLTYNMIFCVIAIPALGFFIKSMIRNIERKIEEICKGLDTKRSKDMCDEKHRSFSAEQIRLAEALDSLFERVNHHKHQKDNGGVIL